MIQNSLARIVHESLTRIVNSPVTWTLSTLTVYPWEDNLQYCIAILHMQTRYISSRSLILKNFGWIQVRLMLVFLYKIMPKSDSSLS